jgi:hypothetical protein
MIMNSGKGGDRDAGKLSISDLLSILPSASVIEEVPLTAPHNYVIVWGHKNM